ncbi:hypothetical protein JCM33374_g5010 [Metschnikowia sp. JCM 33374]|nr:hypothetical protein JCM33374_g5010 [Metschnikowia sp. JCM 33374]
MDVQKLSIELDKSSRRKIINRRFKLLQGIGQGQFGKVFLAEDLESDTQPYVAIKTIHRVDTARLITKTYLSHTTKIKREIQIMKECDHPNVVKLFQVVDDMRFDKILLVLEYCALGEIDWKKYNHYHEKYYKSTAKCLPLNRILRDVVNGLEYLHSYKNIIHRDLKPSNLLISSDRTIKISDFGVSLILENNANDDRELGKTMGTPAFFAPELCQFVNNRLSSFNESDLKRSRIDARIDLWSLGVTLYCLFFHQLPFEGFNEFGLFKNIVNGVLKFPVTKRTSLAKPEDVKELALLEDLIKRLLAKDPSNRPTLAEIKAHGFTNFDLSKSESEKFRNINRHIVSAQSPMAAEVFAAENRLTQRLRNLFISRSEVSSTAKSTIPGELPSSVRMNPVPEREPKMNILELENVDDLLDSYLDDSSSFGSFDEDDTDPVVVDTADLFGALNSPGPKHLDIDYQEPNSSDQKSDQMSPDQKSNQMSPDQKSPDQTISDQKNSVVNSENSISNTSSYMKSMRDIPPPLKLSNSNFDSQKPKLSPLSPLYTGQRTPSTAHPVVAIGPDSPSSMNPVFSPSRRFFSRFKKKTTEPTISALSGDITDSLGTASSYANLAPPPTFGGSWDAPTSNRNSLSSVDSGVSRSRKSSVGSNSMGSISKLSSSSSSLNLHAYLMDSPTSSSKRNSFTGTLENDEIVEQDDPDQTQDTTESSDDDADRTMSMDQFLDRLDD